MQGPDEITKIAIFEGKNIRKILHGGEWWFSIVDIIQALTDSTQPSKYWTAMKARVENEGDFQLSTICRQLKLEASDGKKYEYDFIENLDYFVAIAKFGDGFNVQSKGKIVETKEIEEILG